MKGKVTHPRICYRCKYPLYKTDYFSRNDHIPKDELQKIWEKDDVELLCCECYEKCQDNPEMINDRLVEIKGAERADLVNISEALQTAEKGINLELIDFYKHNNISNLFFIDFYHDVNVRYRYIISDDKSTIITYVSVQKTNNNSKTEGKEISNLIVKGILYFYKFYDKLVEL